MLVRVFVLGLVHNHANFVTVADLSLPLDTHSRLTQAPHSDQIRTICHWPDSRYYELTLCDTAVGAASQKWLRDGLGPGGVVGGAWG